MRIFASGLTLFLTILFTSVCYSQTPSGKSLTCINGENATNKNWINSINTASKSNLNEAYKEFLEERTQEESKLKESSSTKAESCPGVTNDLLKKVLSTSFKIESKLFLPLKIWEALTYYWQNAENVNKPKSSVISTSCIEEAMKIETGGKSFYCFMANNQSSSGQQSSIEKVVSKTSKECIDDKLVDYVSFSVNSAIQCFSDSVESDFGPIDSQHIFEKLTNESAFDYTLSDPSKGISIGQITGPAKEEISHPGRGRGNYILQKISESTSKHCKGFKSVAQEDIDKTPSKIKLHNLCKWVSPGDGLARSLIYSIGYYLTLRDKYVIPELKKFASFNSQNISKEWTEVIKSATMVAYSGEGFNSVKLKLNKLGQQPKPSEIKKALQTSKYFNAVTNKKNIVYSKVQENLQAQNNQEGTASARSSDSKRDSGESLCFINYPNP